MANDPCVLIKTQIKTTTNINNNTYKHGTEKTTAQTTGPKNIL